MLVKADDYPKHGLDVGDASVPGRLESIEHKIRACTNNGFQVRRARLEASSSNGTLDATSPHMRPGDTVEVSASGVNDGLYVVTSVGTKYTTLDANLLDVPFNRVTLVRYPPDVVAGAVGMLRYDERMADKRGIASETLSRHSVSYAQPTGDGSIAGYPFDVTAFLKPYMRPWF